jgi:hypothetical protein
MAYTPQLKKLLRYAEKNAEESNPYFEEEKIRKEKEQSLEMQLEDPKEKVKKYIRDTFFVDGKPIIVTKEEVARRSSTLKGPYKAESVAAYARIVIIEQITDFLKINPEKTYRISALIEELDIYSWRLQAGVTMAAYSSERDNDIVAIHVDDRYVYKYSPVCAERLKQISLGQTVKRKCYENDCNSKKCPIYDKVQHT